MENKKKEIFLSYCHADIGRAIDIYEHLKEKLDINLHMDRIDIGKWGNIREYMQSISKMDYVILLISKQYLKSPNCMYEVLEVLRDRNFSNKIFPAVIETSIYKTEGRIKYVKFWEEEYKKLKKSLEGIEVENTGVLVRDLNIRNNIASNMAEFLDTIAYMNNPEIGALKYIIEEKIKEIEHNDNEKVDDIKPLSAAKNIVENEKITEKSTLKQDSPKNKKVELSQVNEQVILTNKEQKLAQCQEHWQQIIHYLFEEKVCEEFNNVQVDKPNPMPKDCCALRLKTAKARIELFINKNSLRIGLFIKKSTDLFEVFEAEQNVIQKALEKFEGDIIWNLKVEGANVSIIRNMNDALNRDKKEQALWYGKIASSMYEIFIGIIQKKEDK